MSKKNIFHIVLLFVFIIGTIIYIIYKLQKNQLFTANAISVIGSFASTLGLIAVFSELYFLTNTYSKAVTRLIYSDSIYDIKEAQKSILLIKDEIDNSGIINSRHNIDNIYNALDSIVRLSNSNDYSKKLNLIKEEEFNAYNKFCKDLYKQKSTGYLLSSAQKTECYETLSNINSYFKDVSYKLK